MARYIRKLTHIGSIGPTEESGFAVWIGYDLVGFEGDLSVHGLVNVEDWPEDRIAQHGVTGFARVEPGDHATWEKLGLRRNE